MIFRLYNRFNRILYAAKIYVLKRILLMSIVLATLLFNHVAYGQSELSKENKLKAAYLLNFTLFISWPEHHSVAAKHSIILCLQGSTEFVQFANELAGGGRFSNEKRLVKVEPLSSADKCDLSYIQQKILNIPSQMQTSVIVADSELVQLDTTAITFFRQHRKLRFEINLLVMQQLDVTVSSELLKLAKVKTE